MPAYALAVETKPNCLSIDFWFSLLRIPFKSTEIALVFLPIEVLPRALVEALAVSVILEGSQSGSNLGAIRRGFMRIVVHS